MHRVEEGPFQQFAKMHGVVSGSIIFTLFQAIFVEHCLVLHRHFRVTQWVARCPSCACGRAQNQFVFQCVIMRLVMLYKHSQEYKVHVMHHNSSDIFCSKSNQTFPQRASFCLSLVGADIARRYLAQVVLKTSS